MEKQVFISLVLALLVVGVQSTKLTFTNRCSFTVWPGTLNNFGKPPLSKTGFELAQGASESLDAPVGWQGRVWGRTGCSTDSNGRFRCDTADCGSGVVACNGMGAVPPATLIEFTLQGDGGKDFYDTSLVDGFNVPFSVAPQGGTGDCTVSGCPADVNADTICPQELRVTAPAGGATIACKSACEAFNTDEYCCRGAFNTSDTCKPTNYSMIFKNACPLAYSYAYNDGSSTFTCTGADYILTYCPGA
ncbi:thaumatin-like protein 1b [Magnolia sinica]|uniref:thaumatin-like protein 1b n=1 Tax=Magnolia sinica TaxID=86752 RepID=UPI0026582E67|nr:thaumatin-like protein 1b [Magnolia sinica]